MFVIGPKSVNAIAYKNIKYDLNGHCTKYTRRSGDELHLLMDNFLTSKKWNYYLLRNIYD
jgi:hypothetical protein